MCARRAKAGFRHTLAHVRAPLCVADIAAGEILAYLLHGTAVFEQLFTYPLGKVVNLLCFLIRRRA